MVGRCWDLLWAHNLNINKSKTKSVNEITQNYVAVASTSHCASAKQTITHSLAHPLPSHKHEMKLKTSLCFYFHLTSPYIPPVRTGARDGDVQFRSAPYRPTPVELITSWQSVCAVWVSGYPLSSPHTRIPWFSPFSVQSTNIIFIYNFDAIFRPRSNFRCCVPFAFCLHLIHHFSHKALLACFAYGVAAWKNAFERGEREKNRMNYLHTLAASTQCDGYVFSFCAQ